MPDETLKELGFRRILNAGGHFTVMGGSCPGREVLQCMEETSGYWIDMKELEVQVGKLLSRYIGCEDGIVTSGAYASNIIATEVALSRARERDARLSNPNVVIQATHITKYAQSFTTPGVRLKHVERKSREESLSDHVDSSTIALTYVLNESEFEFDMRETVEAARKTHLPVIVDAAVVDPPIRGIKQVLTYDPDFISISGGKGFNGPSASGLLIGKIEFISRARELSFPNYGPGRGMKVSKEQIAGLITAVRSATEIHEEVEIARWRKNIETIQKSISDVRGIRTEVVFPSRINFPQPIPRLIIHIDIAGGVDLALRIRTDLLHGEPPIFTRPLDDHQIEGPRNRIVIDARLLRKNEVKLVAELLKLSLLKFLR